MFNLTKLTVACGLLAGICFAQSASEQEKYYHLDFVVKELDGGKVVNARHYLTSMMTGAKAGGGCNIRTGSKVPVPVSGGGSQFTYIDVGVNIDCSAAQETDGNLALGVVAEVSSAASSQIRRSSVRTNGTRGSSYRSVKPPWFSPPTMWLLKDRFR